MRHEPIQEAIKTKKLEIVDDDGRVRIELSVGDGRRLWMYDSSGEARIEVGMRDEGRAVGISFWGRQGTERAHLTVFGEDTSLTLLNGRGDPQIELSISSEDETRIVVSDEDGREVWSAP